MMDLGFEVKLEPVTVRHWVRGQEEAQLTRYPGQVPGTSQKIVVTALGNAVATPPDGITATIIVVNTFDEFDRLSTNASAVSDALRSKWQVGSGSRAGRVRYSASVCG